MDGAALFFAASFIFVEPSMDIVRTSILASALESDIIDILRASPPAAGPLELFLDVFDF